VSSYRLRVCKFDSFELLEVVRIRLRFVEPSLFESVCLESTTKL
jgi:hypothetical protein